MAGCGRRESRSGVDGVRTGWAGGAAGVVGDGTPESCTETALAAAIAGGGLVTFNCGRGPVSIPMTAELEIAANTQIDGGGLVTLDGQLSTRIFLVDDGARLDLANITLTRGNGVGQGPGIQLAGGSVTSEGGTLTLTNSTGEAPSAGTWAAQSATSSAVSRSSTAS